jgi:cell division protein FtsW
VLKLKNSQINNSWWGSIDKIIFIPILILLFIGVIAISSASQKLGTVNLKSNLMWNKHLVFCLLSLFTIFIISKLSTKQIIILSISLFSLSIILCFIALTVSQETKGATRWLNLIYFSIQPSELAKPTFIILSSLLFVRYKIKEDFSLIVNLFCLSLISLILIIQPDFGMFILICVVWIIQLFTINIKSKILFPIISFIFGVFLLCFFILDHVRFRIMNYLFSDIGDNYQIMKSIDSFKSGGLFGQGIGEGVISKKLPDSHSDFVYALISEELGIIVAIIILFLYVIPYIRIHYICQRSSNLFIITSLTGLSNIFLFQTIINISSTLNIIPTKGMTLPFISYGGSSLISSALLIGFILVLIKENINE